MSTPLMEMQDEESGHVASPDTSSTDPEAPDTSIANLLSVNNAPVSLCIWISLYVRQVILAVQVIMLVAEARKETGGRQVAVTLLQAAAVLVASIVPFWTRPKLTLDLIHKMGMSACQFTAIVQGVSLTLLAVGTYQFGVPDSGGALRNPLGMIATLFLSSLLLNEIKWAPVYFHSHWTPVSNWAERNLGGVSSIFFFVVPGSISTLFHSPWPYVLSVIMILLTDVWVFMSEKFVTKIDPDGKVRSFISESSEYQPLQWNDPRSYEYYRIHVYEHGKFNFCYYFFFQFL
ncbi:hypothetical protein CJU90_1114 [Yarrowia sp. C11]|nr:hypothetical protein CKK34_2528 [Yarrowia sp. E02]KAG5373416.1 hypothetical protein CJU90_1114 [Yarrowia sp. C11]